MASHTWLRARLLPLAAAPLLGALGVVEAWTDLEYRPHFDELAVVAGWLALAFVVQAFRPALGAVLVAGFYPVTLVLDAPGPGGTGLIAVLVASGYAGYAASRTRSLLAVSLAVAIFVGTALFQYGLTWDTVFFPAVFFPAWWAGRLVRRERERSVQLQELAAELDATREAAVRAAAQEERTRVAREVHDAVAHSVSVMTLQIGGLRRQLDGVLDDRPAEREVLLGLERLGRETVDELRGLVGILREPGDHGSGTAPLPSLTRVQDVVDDVRAAGLDVDLTVEGEVRELPRALDVSAYRIVQEALTNVLRHAPGSTAQVHVRYATDAVDVTVRDESSADALVQAAHHGRLDGARSNGSSRVGGHGLAGMRERTQMFGGELTTRHHETGFEVHAHLPTGRGTR
jgi:signal transduction histidine kinase